MSRPCPHGYIIGLCRFGCTVLWAGGGWVQYQWGATPQWWLDEKERRRHLPLLMRIRLALTTPITEPQP